MDQLKSDMRSGCTTATVLMIVLHLHFRYCFYHKMFCAVSLLIVLLLYLLKVVGKSPFLPMWWITSRCCQQWPLLVRTHFPLQHFSRTELVCYLLPPPTSVLSHASQPNWLVKGQRRAWSEVGDSTPMFWDCCCWVCLFFANSSSHLWYIAFLLFYAITLLCTCDLSTRMYLNMGLIFFSKEFFS